MDKNVCNICGANYVNKNGRWKCPACGAFKPEEISNEEVTLLFHAAQNLRLCDFDAAERQYSDIVNKFPKNPEGYWGRVLARFGIKYEDDFDGKKIPTCYAMSIESFAEDKDYKMALSLADEEMKSYYQKQAGYIDRVRQEWVNKAQKEKPYDIFICYKDSDLANGIDRTNDSVEAQQLYTHLVSQGYRVFYSRDSLRDKVGEKYEPYIFNALNTAKVMIVYGSRADYITSTWLKNEWTRYEKRIQAGTKKPNSLLVCCDGFSPNELPKTLSSKQCLDATQKTFYGDLDAAIKNVIHEKKEEPKAKGDTASAAAPVKKKKAGWIVALLALAAAAVGAFFVVNSLQTRATITYDTNGGSGRVQSQNVKIGSDYVLINYSGTKENSQFAGWSETKDGTVDYANGSTIYAVSHDTTLYAVWEATPLTVTLYNYDGTEKQVVDLHYGDTYILPECPYEREGCTFSYWAVAELDMAYDKGSPIVMEQSLQCVAVFSYIDYPVSFDANGGQGTMDSQNFHWDVSQNLSSCTFTREGYTFKGWSTSATGPVAYNDGASYATNKEPVTLYAVWEIIRSSVTFLGSNGTQKEAYTVSYGETITVPGCADVIPGYTFSGWTDASGNHVNAGETIVVKNNQEWTAQYTANENAIVYHANGGDGTMANLTFRTGDNVTLNKCAFTRAGYHFVGWSATENGATAYADGAAMNGITDTTTNLYAVWQRYKTVTFDYGNQNVKTMEVTEAGGTVTLEATSKVGYDFGGWYASSDYAGTPVTTASFDALAETYYAKWLIQTYTVTYRADNAVVGTASFTVEQMTAGTAPAIPAKTGYTAAWPTFTLELKDITVNAVYTPMQFTVKLDDGTSTKSATVTYKTAYTLSVPTKSHCEFTGWYCGDVQMTDAAGNSLVPYAALENKTFTAGWIAERLTLTFVTDGGSAVASQKVNYNEPYEITAVSEKTGYMFAGWYDQSLTTEYVGALVWSGDTTVYAKWIKSTAISNAAGLKAIADDPTANYHLVANVNLRGEEWTPIAEFSGVLNGNGYKIYNFTISASNADFGFILNNKGTIKNITFDKAELINSYVMYDADGKRGAAVGVVCAVNNGTLSNVKVTDSMIQHTTELNGTFESNVWEGGVVGCNKAQMINVSFSGDMTITIGGELHESTTKYVNIGGVTGWNASGATVNNASSSGTITVKDTAIAGRSGYYYNGGNFYEHDNYSVENVRIGGLVGLTNGTISCGNASMTIDSSANFAISSAVEWHHTTLTGNYAVGGAIGLLDQGSSAAEITAGGSVSTTFTGDYRGYGYKYVGGVVGYVYSGTTLNICSSDADVTCLDCGNGYFGGIAGEVYGGRVSNAAFYGTVTLAEGKSDVGVAGGLVGRNEGTLTQALTAGTVTGKWQYAADVTGETTANGSNARCIDEGNLHVISATGDGTSNKCYIVDETIARSKLYDADNLFEEMALLDSETWSVVPGVKIYLTALAD